MFGAVVNRVDYLTEYHLADALQHLSSFNLIKNDTLKPHHKWLEEDHPIFFNPQSIFPSLKIPVADLIMNLGEWSQGEIIDNSIQQYL